MGDMGDDFSALREHNRIERESRRNDRTVEIDALSGHGYAIHWLTPYHCRINSRLDLYPTRSRWHDLKTKERGGFGLETVLQIVTRRFQ